MVVTTSQYNLVVGVKRTEKEYHRHTDGIEVRSVGRKSRSFSLIPYFGRLLLFVYEEKGGLFGRLSKDEVRVNGCDMVTGGYRRFLYSFLSPVLDWSQKR